MKYWFLKIHIQNGEYEHDSIGLHQTKGEKEFDAEDYVSEFYPNKAWDSDGVHYFNGGEIACSVYELKEITKQEYNTLKKFI